MTQHGIDPDMTALPYEAIGDAALERARSLGATYADFRFERIKSQTIVTRDRELETLRTLEDVGYGVRVIVRGAWGFAAGVDLTVDAAAATAARAVEVAATFSALNGEPVELASEAAYTGTWVSSYEIDPFDIPEDEKAGFLLSLSDTVLGSGKANHVFAHLDQVKENKYLASLDGTRVVQQRIRVQSDLQALRVDPATGAFETMTLAAPPAGRGWEYCARLYPYAEEAARIGDLLEEKMASPSVEPGSYDLVIHPTNLWLTIHESIGHSTELDRALGYEANYAGTSFATLDKLNELRFGSPLMNVTGDRVTEHGLSTVAWDDEGVSAQTWDIIRDGMLVGYQLNRQMASRQGFGRSNGCAFADSPGHVPLQRMPNVSLQPSPEDVSLDDLIDGVEDGIYIVGNNSWSIDQQRYNFQFTGQRFYRIHNGRLDGQLRDVAYQSRTTDFWNAMDAVGGASTYVLGGAFNCGKGQPSQIAPVTHGAPAARFRGITILNTATEGGR